MNVLNIALQAQGGGSMSMILMMVALFAVMYFFMIRPQQKKQKEIQNFRNSLAVGNEVITAGGVYGTIKEIDNANNIIVLEVSKGTTIRVDRNFVYQNPGAAFPQK